MACAGDNITCDRACRRKTSCSAAVEVNITHSIAVQIDCVQDTVHIVEKIIRINKHGRDHRPRAVICIAAHGQKLDLQPHRACIGNIDRIDIRDSFRRDVLIRDMSSVSDGGKDRDFSAGIPALYIRFRMQLGKAVLLGFPEGFLKALSLIRHRCQDIIRCPVQDTGDPVDLIRSQRRIQRVDDRNAASAAGFEEIVDIVFLRKVAKKNTVLRDKFLVGGTDALSRADRLLRKLKCRSETAHRLYDDRDIRII